MGSRNVTYMGTLRPPGGVSGVARGVSCKRGSVHLPRPPFSNKIFRTPRWGFDFRSLQGVSIPLTGCMGCHPLTPCAHVCCHTPNVEEQGTSRSIKAFYSTYLQEWRIRGRWVAGLWVAALIGDNMRSKGQILSQVAPKSFFWDRSRWLLLHRISHAVLWTIASAILPKTD